MASRELRVVISGDSASFEKAMARAQASSAKAATGIEAAGRRMESAGKSLQRGGRTLTRGITLPIALAAGASAKLAIDFEKSMRNVNSIAGLPEKQFQKLNKQVLSLAGPVAQAPKTLSEGLYDLVSSGFKANESIGILKVAAKAATAGLTTTEVSVKAVAAALNAYHRPASEAGAISDDLFETVNRGVVSFDELASSIGFVLPAASTLGITTKEVGASISTLTKEGQSGETAITNLNQTMTAFIKPTKGMKAALKELGYASGEQLIEQKGFQGALEEVTKTAHGSKEAIGGMFSNVRAMRGVFGLTGKNIKSAREDLKAFNGDAGSTAKVFKEQSKSLSFQWGKFRSELEVVAIRIGNKLIPVLREGVEKVKGIVNWFSDLPHSVQNTVLKVGLVVAALGPVLSITGKILSGWGKLFTLIGKAGHALGIFEATQAGGSAAGGAAAGAAGGGVTAAEGAAAGSAATGGIFGGLFKSSGGVKGAAQVAGRTLAGLVGGYFVTELGTKIVEKATGADILEGQSVAKALFHGFNTSGVAETEKSALEMHRAQEDALKRLWSNLNLDALAGLKKLRSDLGTGLKQIGNLWGTGTVPWRVHSVEAMKATVDSIRAGMRNGSVIVKNGTKAIEQIFSQIHLLQGSDPLGLARGFSQSFKKAGSITQSGMENIVEKLSLMPKGAREKAQDAVLGMANAWAKGHPKIEAQVDVLRKNLVSKFGKTNRQLSRGALATMQSMEGSFQGGASTMAGALQSILGNLGGALTALGVTKIPSFTVSYLKAHAPGGGGKYLSQVPSVEKQRGGPINLGAPTGDTVPAMLERGEYVLNRKAVAAIGTSALDSINFGAAPRFQKGGALGGEPRITGPGLLPTGEQRGVHKVYKAATRYYNQHAEPGRVLKMLHYGERETHKGYPYVYGGGHGALGVGPFDCSGLVSGILGAGNFLSAPMSVQQGSGLYTLGQPGPGKFFTWGVRGTSGESAHTMISVRKPGDKGWAFFEAGGSGGGAHEDSGWDGSFQFRHMPGFQKGGKIPDKAAEQIAKFGQAAFDPKSKHFVGWGFQKGGTVSGKVSWFNGGATAGGGNTSQPGIAMNLNPGTESGWDNPTTQGWMTASKAGHPVYAKVSISGHSANLPIIDLGPAGFTQRAIDVTEGGVKKLGFTTANFPTDATGTAVLGGGSGVAGKVSIPKGTSAHGGTSAGGATAKEIKRATKLGAKHAKNPKVSTNVPTSVLPEWGAGLPRFQREELEGRGTTQPERETILGNAESNANFAEGIAGKALERAEAAYEENPTEANWSAVEEAATGVTQKRAGQSAASGARKLFEKGLIRHTTKQIKQINYQLAHSAGKLSAKQIKALKEKRAVLVEQRSSARGEAQGASEALMGYEEESGNEAAERRRQHEEAERARPHEQAELSLARAEGTTGKSDDIKALEELRGVAEQELKYAESTGNLEDIADATRNLTQATENLKSLATAAFEEQAEGELALAELTEGLADDLAVLHNKLSFAEQRLAESEAEGNWAEIANWAHEVKGLTEAIKSDEGAESSAQLAEELKALRESIEQQTKFAEAATSTSSATAWKALADILSGNLGPRTIATSKTAGTGNIGTVSRL